MEPSDTLVVGQALVIQFPERTHTVRPGETLDAIARQYGVSLRQLYRNNPILGGRPLLYPDLTLVLSYRGTKEGTLSVNGYAYPYIDKSLLQATLPYLTFLTPFTYGFYPHRCAGPPGRRGTDRNGAPGRYRPSHASVHPDGGGRFFQ